ncbi:MAG: UPF0280 family protein [Afipia sp.]
MKRLPQIGWLADGRRLHLHDGPIDLIVEARGTAANVRAAYDAAVGRFIGLLDELCGELPELRKPARLATNSLKGIVARRMHDAVAPFAAGHFITPMAAVAGAVAEEILDAMVRASDLRRAYVNNGGDIALHIADDECFTVGLIDRPDRPQLIGRTVVESEDSTRGIATSGWRGRSFSLGIADAVTVLARTSARADAAATIIANAIDVPEHPLIVRYPANEVQPDSDLGARLVTREVGELSLSDIMTALDAGADIAHSLLDTGLIDGAALHLQGETRVVALKNIDGIARRPLSRAAARAEIESLLHV